MDLTSGNIRRNILLFSLPLMASFVIQQAYSIVDTIIVSNFCLDTDLACISCASIITNLLCSVLAGSTVGFGILISKAKGENNEEAVMNTIQTGMVFFLVFSILLNAPTAVFSKQILTLTQVDTSILDRSALFLVIYCISAILFGLTGMVTRALENLGDSKSPFRISLFTGGLNIILDLITVLIFHTDALGPIYATVFCETLALLLSIFKLKKLLKNEISTAVRKEKRKADWNVVKESFSYSSAAVVQYTLNSFSLIILQSFINRAGVDYINGFSAGILLYSMLNNGINGYGQGYQVFLSQNLGAEKKDRLKESVPIVRFDSMLCCAIVSLLLIVLVNPVVRFIVGTKGETAVSFGKHYALCMIPCYFLGILNQLKGSRLRVTKHNDLLLKGTILLNTVLVLSSFFISRVNINFISLSYSFAALAQLTFLTISEKKYEDVRLLFS